MAPKGQDTKIGSWSLMWIDCKILSIVFSYRLGSISILGRCHSLSLFKEIGKIMCILISHQKTDGTALFAGAAQKFLCFSHAVICQVFDKGLTGLLAENGTQMVG